MIGEFLITLIVALITILSLLLVIAGIDWIYLKITLRKIRKARFNNFYSVGSLYHSNLRKQKFPCGKWEYLGCDQNNTHVFERIK